MSLQQQESAHPRTMPCIKHLKSTMNTPQNLSGIPQTLLTSLIAAVTEVPFLSLHYGRGDGDHV